MIYCVLVLVSIIAYCIGVDAGIEKERERTIRNNKVMRDIMKIYRDK